MNGAPSLVVVLAKSNGKNNRRSLGFARDDTVFLPPLHNSTRLQIL